MTRLTDFGKELRKIRIDVGERLFDMAKRLDVSAAFLSAVELGEKQIPPGLIEDVIVEYGLDLEAVGRLRQAADRSRATFKLKAHSPIARDTAALLARKFESLNDDDLRRIHDILRKGAQ